MKSTMAPLTWIFMLIFTEQMKAVTVNPYACPTNKIAPHRRISNSKSIKEQPRTLGAYIDLLAPDLNQYGASLQEEPQKDDPDDCGDIEDYDENDITSLTPSSQQRVGLNSGRLFFNGFLRPPSAYPPKPPAQPLRPPSNYPPPRPPYWSGGQFGNNPYRPPVHYNPSDNIKPVYEDGVNDQPVIYRPGVVGGPSHQVVGASTTPLRPPRPKRPTITTHPQRVPPNLYQTQPPQSNTDYTTRRPRLRKLNMDNDGIIGSFLDLFF